MPTSSDRYRLWPPDRRIAAGLAAAGALVAGTVAGFAYVGGFLSPGRLTQAEVIDTFQAVDGISAGFRRNHAKGLCFIGRFESNGNGARLSKASVFAQGSVPVIGRFATAGGKPFAADNAMQVRSMAVSFRPPDGEEWRTGMNNIPVFPFRDVQAFYEQLAAGKPDPATGKPDPARMQSFLAAHPETAKAIGIIRQEPSATGFENATYNGLNAFRFVDANGASTPVRWSMVADDPFVAQAPGQAAPASESFLFDALVARLSRGPLQWHLVVTVGQPGDQTKDATVAWPADREKVTVGTLVVERLEAEGPGNCRDVNFDPLVLPPGIDGSDDPLLAARSATYSVSFTRRSGEPKSPSAVQVPPAGSGGRP